MANPSLHLGAWKPIDGSGGGGMAHVPANHLVTHGVIVGMTGSGKSGLIVVMAEEALRAKVPILMIDVKGDLPNLLLSFPRFDPADLVPWVEPAALRRSQPCCSRRSRSVERPTWYWVAMDMYGGKSPSIPSAKSGRD